jgi:hypothetical protein
MAAKMIIPNGEAAQAAHIYRKMLPVRGNFYLVMTCLSIMCFTLCRLLS